MTPDRLQQIAELYHSKLWPNLHHFLYILGRAHNGAFDSSRIAVLQAPPDKEGFDALPALQRKAWEEAVSAYQIHASVLDIGYGSLVDVNYAVADLRRWTANRRRQRDPS
jgi:hypothetical protein